MDENGKSRSHLWFGIGTAVWAALTWYLIKITAINFAARDTVHKGVVTVWIIIFLVIFYYFAVLRDFVRSFRKK